MFYILNNTRRGNYRETVGRDANSSRGLVNIKIIFFESYYFRETVGGDVNSSKTN